MKPKVPFAVPITVPLKLQDRLDILKKVPGHEPIKHTISVHDQQKKGAHASKQGPEAGAERLVTFSPQVSAVTALRVKDGATQQTADLSAQLLKQETQQTQDLNDPYQLRGTSSALSSLSQPHGGMSPFKMSKVGNKPTLVLQTSASVHSTDQKVRSLQSKKVIHSFLRDQSSNSSKDESSAGFLAQKQFTFQNSVQSRDKQMSPQINITTEMLRETEEASEVQVQKKFLKIPQPNSQAIEGSEQNELQSLPTGETPQRADSLSHKSTLKEESQHKAEAPPAQPIINFPMDLYTSRLPLKQTVFDLAKLGAQKPQSSTSPLSVLRDSHSPKRPISQVLQQISDVASRMMPKDSPGKTSFTLDKITEEPTRLNIRPVQRSKYIRAGYQGIVASSGILKGPNLVRQPGSGSLLTPHLTSKMKSLQRRVRQVEENSLSRLSASVCQSHSETPVRDKVVSLPADAPQQDPDDSKSREIVYTKRPSAEVRSSKQSFGESKPVFNPDLQVYMSHRSKQLEAFKMTAALEEELGKQNPDSVPETERLNREYSNIRREVNDRKEKIKIVFKESAVYNVPQRSKISNLLAKNPLTNKIRVKQSPFSRKAVEPRASKLQLEKVRRERVDAYSHRTPEVRGYSSNFHMMNSTQARIETTINHVINSGPKDLFKGGQGQFYQKKTPKKGDKPKSPANNLDLQEEEHYHIIVTQPEDDFPEMPQPSSPTHKDVNSSIKMLSTEGDEEQLEQKFKIFKDRPLPTKQAPVAAPKPAYKRTQEELSEFIKQAQNQSKQNLLSVVSNQKLIQKNHSFIAKNAAQTISNAKVPTIKFVKNHKGLYVSQGRGSQEPRELSQEPSNERVIVRRRTREADMDENARSMRIISMDHDSLQYTGSTPSLVPGQSTKKLNESSLPIIKRVESKPALNKKQDSGIYLGSMLRESSLDELEDFQQFPGQPNLQNNLKAKAFEKQVQNLSLTRLPEDDIPKPFNIQERYRQKFSSNFHEASVSELYRDSSLSQMQQHSYKRKRIPLQNQNQLQLQHLKVSPSAEILKLAKQPTKKSLQPKKKPLYKGPVDEGMKYDEVKVLSDQYLLPSKVIYQLNSEFNCLKDIAKDIVREEYEEALKEQQLREKGVVATAGEEEPPSQASSMTHFQIQKFKFDEESLGALEAATHHDYSTGIPIKTFIKTCQELREKHQSVAERILDALGLPLGNKNTVINWQNFLRMQTILRYFTATKDQFIEFWMKFLNPNSLPFLPYKELYGSLELLVRGSFTQDSTLISEKFAEGFCRMLEAEDCMIVDPSYIESKEALVKGLTRRGTLFGGKIDSLPFGAQMRQNTLVGAKTKKSIIIQPDAPVTTGLYGMLQQNKRKKTMEADEDDEDPRKREAMKADMKKLRTKLKRNEIDIEYLNQCLKWDSEYVNFQP